jgi:hypothetical protein
MEKEAWLELLATLAVLVFYIHGMLGLEVAFATNPSGISMLVLYTFLVSIGLTIIISIFFGIGKKVINFCFGFEGNPGKTQIDERDKLIQLKAMRWAYYTLNIGIFYIVGNAIFNEIVSSKFNNDYDIIFGDFPNFDFTIHSMIILIIACHIVQNTVQIYLHRKGV